MPSTPARQEESVDLRAIAKRAGFFAISLLRIRHTLAHPPPREEVAARFAGHT